MWDKSQITEDISEASNLKLKDYLFNKVYTTGILSEQWKGSKIVPTLNKTGFCIIKFIDMHLTFNI